MQGPLVTREQKGLAALVGGVALIALGIGGTIAVRQFTTRLTAEAAKTEAAIEQAKGLRLIANAERARADSARARAAGAEKRAVTYHAQYQDLRAKADAKVAVAPPECEEPIAAMTAAADAAAQEARSATEALDGQKEAAGHLDAALAADDKALDTVVPAAEKLVDASRKGFFARILPKIDFPSVTAGIDKDLDANVVVGVSLHW